MPAATTPGRRPPTSVTGSISREGTDYPSDANHEARYRAVGAEPIRGTARLDGPGRVRVDLADGGERVLHGRDIVIAVGSHSRIPDIAGPRPDRRLGQPPGHRRPRAAAVAADHGRRTDRHRAGPGLRALRRAGHAGRLQSAHPRPRPRPQLRVRPGGAGARRGHRAHRRPCRARGAPKPARMAPTACSSPTARSAEGHEVMVSIGRAIPFEGLGLETIGVTADGRMPRPDEQPAHRATRLRGGRSGRARAAHAPGPLPG